jgi:hypothetical protein
MDHVLEELVDGLLIIGESGVHSDTKRFRRTCPPDLRVTRYEQRTLCGIDNAQLYGRGLRSTAVWL